MRRILLMVGVFLALAAPAGAGTLFVIDGRGWGHGIGMSQYGAKGYAENGWGYARILAHYYRGTQLRVVPAREVRVLLAETKPRVRVGSPKPFLVVDVKGKKRRLPAGDVLLRPGAPQGKRLKGLKPPLRFVPGFEPLRLDGNGYRGALVVHPDRGSLTVVNRVPLDRYLRGVVPWEMPNEWHPEALKAQAVVARSYALATLKPSKLYDLYADVRSQVYGGIRAEEPSTNRAIGATAGRVLLWNGNVATTFYHSTSGGRTAPVADVWPKARPVPYLVGVPDPFDNASKHHRWGPFTLKPEEAAAQLGIGGVQDLRVRRAPSGRAAAVEVRTTNGSRVVLAQDFRATMELRSTWFTVRVLRLDPQPRALASRPVTLTGFVRGLSKVRLQQQVNGGTWTTVQPVAVRADGRFAIVVRPQRTTSYRLATREAAGGAVTITVR